MVGGRYGGSEGTGGEEYPNAIQIMMTILLIINHKDNVMTVYQITLPERIALIVTK